MTVEAAAATPSEALGRRTHVSLGPTGWVCAAYLVLISLLALLSPLLPFKPAAQDLSLRLLPPFSTQHGFAYVLGGDELGRSVLARVIDGGRVSLVVGLATAVIALVIGVLFGVTAAIAGGVWEWFVLRLIDVWMSLPTLLIALVVLYALGSGVTKVVMVLAILRWVVFARVARALTLSIKERQYFDAARAIGCSVPRLIWQHVIPNLRWDILTVGTLEVARAMLTEAALSFLGLGVQPPASSWGLQLSNARSYLSTNPWLMVAPGLAILLTTLSINLIVHVVRTSSGTGGNATVWMGTLGRHPMLARDRTKPVAA
ncbi:MAG TPA: ABC transporter permease [Cellulomonas sp.]